MVLTGVRQINYLTNPTQRLLGGEKKEDNFCKESVIKYHCYKIEGTQTFFPFAVAGGRLQEHHQQSNFKILVIFLVDLIVIYHFLGLFNFLLLF